MVVFIFLSMLVDLASPEYSLDIAIRIDRQD